MGFWASLFGGNSGIADDDNNIGDQETYDQVYQACRKELEQDGWVNDSTSSLQVLTDDHGFFKDVFKVMTGGNPIYQNAREEDIHFFVQQTSFTMLWAGIYATMCARIIQKPLYLNYREVWRRFTEEGTLPCVMMFLGPAHGPHNYMSWDCVMSGIFNKYPEGLMDQLLEKSKYDDQVVLAYCKAFYHAGNAIGFYYI